jgi:UMF1 family MFS transporter
MSYFKNRQVWSWALYDFANSAYATAVMAGLFPIFYKSFWSQGVAVTESTFYLGLANSLSSLVIVLLAPFMGALADRAGRRKRLLVISAFFGCLNTAVLSFIPAGDWLWAFFIYLFATVGFTSSVVFSDALLTQVAEPGQFTKVSSLGYGLGYLGGGLLFLLNVLMITQYQWFGFTSMNSATQWAFLSVALWWGLFTLPVLFWVPDSVKPHQGISELIMVSIQQVWLTLKHIRQHKPVFLFLLSYWFYIDAVDTIVRMAVDYGMSLGLQSTDLILALLITQFVGFPAAIIYGYLGHHFGIKRALLVGLMVYLFVILWAYQIQSATDFYVLAVIVGLVQGGVQALSRAYFAHLIPTNQAAEFFGFYNIIGKFSVIIGPVLMGAVALISGDNRMSILSIAVLLLIGMVLLFKVSDNRRP